MYKIKPFLFYVGCVGLMSSAVTFANTDASTASTQAPQQQTTQTTGATFEGSVGAEEEQSLEEDFSIDESGVEGLRNHLLEQSKSSTASTSSSSTTSTSSSGTTSSAVKTVESNSYPTFSKSELDNGPAEPEIVAYYEANDSTAENASDDTDSPLNYSPETALLYQHLPTDPVYTYGKDKQEEGACVGTAEVCAASELIWENFKEREGVDLLLSEDEEKKGQLIMPEEYDQSVNQPHVE